MTIALTAVLLLVQADEARIKSLIDALAGDSIEDREQAADELARFGAAALPGLKALSSQGTPEARARAADVIKRIERTAQVKEQLGPPRLVTLRWEKKPLRDALAELREKAGIGVACPDDVAAVPITFSCDARPAWQALADACRAHGGLWFTQATVSAQAPPRAPERFVDGIYMTVERVRLSTRAELGGARRNTTEVFLTCAWDGGRSPRQVTVQLDAFADDAGSDLRVPNSGVPRAMTLHSGAPLAWSIASTDRLPDEKAAMLTLRGRVVFSYALGFAEAAFGTRGGETKTVGGLQLKLATFTKTGSGKVIEFHGEADAGETPPPWAEAVIRDDEGTDHTVHLAMHPLRQIFALRHQARFTGYMRKDVAVRTLTVRIPKDVHRHEVPFEFKDVPIR